MRRRRPALPHWARSARRSATSLKKPGIEAGIFGLILVLVILLEPLGMYGRWLKIKLFFSTFPMYKASTFKRQKTYMRSERLR